MDKMIVALVVMGVMLVPVLAALPNTWSGKGLPDLERVVRSFWFWGEASLQGFLRANPIAIVACTGLWVAGFTAELLKVIGPSIVRTVLSYVFAAGGIVSLIAGVLMVTVMLFNFPKLVVPPSLRHQSGLLTRSSIRKALSRTRRDPGDRP